MPPFRQRHSFDVGFSARLTDIFAREIHLRQRSIFFCHLRLLLPIRTATEPVLGSDVLHCGRNTRSGQKQAKAFTRS